jgi:membrane-bound acyltransferase YfiQ involved in biofilm formation
MPEAKLPPPHPESGRRETEEERTDRNLLELLNELRVAMPGVQILFAFLLVVPFTERFDRLTNFQEKVFFVALICAAIASAVLIAPSVHHRATFGQQDKRFVVDLGNRLAIVGLAFLALSMTAVILLITDFLFATETAIVTTGLIALLFLIVWGVVPAYRRVTRHRRA